MSPHLRPLRLGAPVLAVALLLAGCAGAAQSSRESGGSSADRKDTVIIGTGAVPQSLEPAIASEVQTDFTVSSMYDKLVTYDADGKIVGRLATSWKTGDGGRSLTLTLRDGVTFHSGNPFTAADVVYTLERDKKLGLGVASFISDLKSVKADDDTHVTITLTGPNASFVGALSKVYVVDSKLVKEHASDDQGQKWLATHDAGSGPYALTSYTANQRTETDRYKGYWQFESSRPEHVVYRYIQESSTLRDELTSGGVDVATGLSGTDLDAAEKISDVQADDLPSLIELFVMFNMEGTLTSDPRVREAIQLAYDYQGHVSSILSGRGSVATGLAAPSVACRYDAGASTQDVAKAKQLVEEAGASGKSLTLAYQTTIPEHAKAATLLQSDLKEIGLNLKLKPVTYPEYSQMIQSKATTPDLGLLWDFPYYPAIGPMLYRVYDSAFVNQTNYSRYSNAEVDSLLAKGLSATDEKSACNDFVAAQKQIVDDRVAMPISNPENTILLRDGLGITYDPTSQLFDVGTLVRK
ncbi:ABC transporter substrate-binding protein [Luteimicrobium xylanilyticum]|uniref:Periplasmic oligopeptide-binding protein n=1 Tax=Luteimicrobium xylanilyticum TaxID=1133546 RepID=A0A5P9Q5P1_9MICO|nr:ABC transporter substrate-binding protein [Luteimicrobium xylanilyticum]QFU96707.1 Periplasmic oligopeptide-binding protein [Luteimicrobium xylanilyticum]